MGREGGEIVGNWTGVQGITRVGLCVSGAHVQLGCQIYFLRLLSLNDLIKKTEIHEEDQRFMQNFGLKSWREETDLSEAVVLV